MRMAWSYRIWHWAPAIVIPIPDTIIAQESLEIPRVVTVPEFTLPVFVPETRQLVGLQGPVFVDGQDTGPILNPDGTVFLSAGDDTLVVDNRYGTPQAPGSLVKIEVEVELGRAPTQAEIDTRETQRIADVASAKAILAAHAPAGVEAETVYGSVVDHLQDQNRVRQPGILDAMVAAPAGTTAVTLTDSAKIADHTTTNAFVSYLSAEFSTNVSQGKWVDASDEANPQDIFFNITASYINNNHLSFPNGVFSFMAGGRNLEAEVISDLNGIITQINVYTVDKITFNLGNDFVKSKFVDDESTRTYDTISGFGSTFGVFYQNFTAVDVQLSSQVDVLEVIDTAGTDQKPTVTRIFAGGGNDTVNVRAAGGTTNIFGDVSPTYNEDFRVHTGSTNPAHLKSALNAQELGNLLLSGTLFDHENVTHVRAVAQQLLNRGVSLVDLDGSAITLTGQITDVVNFDSDAYHAQIWILLKAHLNDLQGNTGSYKDFLDDLGPFGSEFSTNLATLVSGFNATDVSNLDVGDLKALATAVNNKGYTTTVSIKTASTVGQLNNSLDAFADEVWDTLKDLTTDASPFDTTTGDWRSHLASVGSALGISGAFNTSSLSHLQTLAKEVNSRQFQATVSIDTSNESTTSATFDRLDTDLEFTFQTFVWRLLKENLIHTDGSAYNPLADEESEVDTYRDHLTDLNAALGLGGTFNPDNVSHLQTLGNALNNEFASLAIDVAGIQLVPSLDVNAYRAEVWDYLTANGVATPTGNDTFNIHSTANRVDGIQANLTLDGQTSSGDFVFVSHTGDGSVNVATLTDTTLTGLGMTGAIHYNNVEILQIDLGSGANTVNVQSTSAITTTTLNTNGGADTINVGSLAPTSGGVADFISGRLTINAGGASDTLNVYDSDDAGGNHGKLTSSRITGLGMGVPEGNGSGLDDGTRGITYNSVQDLNLFLGSGGDTFTIASTHGSPTFLSTGGGADTVNVQTIAQSTTVETDGGTDTINVGSVAPTNGGTVNGVTGLLTLTGGSNVDTVNVYDSGDGAVNAGQLTATNLTGLGMSLGIAYTSENLNIHLGSGADIFTINSTHAGNTTLAANGEADRIDIFGSSGTVSVSGGGAGDKFNVYNTAASTLLLEGNAAGDTFNVQAMAGIVTLRGGAGSDHTNVGSNAPGVSGNVDAIAGLLVVEGGGGTDDLNVDDTGDGDGVLGQLSSTRLTGLGMGGSDADAALLNDAAHGITYSALEAVSIGLGSGADIFTVLSTHAGSTNLATGANADEINVETISGLTTIDGQGEADTVNVGRTIGGGETVNGIQAALILGGGGGGASDTLNVSEAGEAAVATASGDLTATILTGLGMAAAGITYGTFEDLNITLGEGGDDFTITSTHAGTTQLRTAGGFDDIRVKTIDGATTILAGAGADDVTVSNNTDLVDDIGGLLEIQGEGGADTLKVDDSGDNAGTAKLTLFGHGSGNTGTLTPTQITGLDMGGSITYGSVEFLDILLGTGDDHFTIVDTHAETTTLDAGSGDDIIDVLDNSGMTTILGNADDDVVNVDTLSTLVSSDENGDRNTLSIDGETGNDTIHIQLAGHGDYVINATDSGGDLGDTITVEGTAAADKMLLRKNFLALLNTSDEDINGFADVERINYDGTFDGTSHTEQEVVGFQFVVRTVTIRTFFGSFTIPYVDRVSVFADVEVIDGYGLTILGNAGEDSFYLDDNATSTQIKGGADKDTFQIGQIFNSDRVVSDVTGDPETDTGIAAGDEIFTVETTRGFLSRGNSFRTAIEGNSGNDEFVVYHNKSILDLDGNAGDDRFTVRAFALVNENEAAQAITNLRAGAGLDYVEYTENALVNIDGGDGNDTLVIIGTEFGDAYVVQADRIVGAGTNVSYEDIEIITVDGAEGNDFFYIDSLNAGVTATVFGGLGSDTFVIGGEAIDVDTGEEDVNLGFAADLARIQGTLNLVAGTTGSSVAIVEAVMLPTESQAATPPPNPNPNFSVDEDDQVDLLTIANDGSSRDDDDGLLTAHRLTGLGMGAGYIDYIEFEHFNMTMGSGSETLTIESTHTGATNIDAADGGDTFNVETISGHTTLELGSGADTVNVSDDAGTVDSIGALLTVSGDAGGDTINILDGDEAGDNLGTLTESTLVGLDMTAGADVNHVQTITVDPLGGSFELQMIDQTTGQPIVLLDDDTGDPVLDGTTGLPIDSVTLAADATEEEIRIALQAFLGGFKTTVFNGVPLSEFTENVNVKRLGDVIVVRLEGAFRGADGQNVRFESQDAHIQIATRNEGINYYGIETLNLDLGSGDDRLNIQGTSAVTNVDAGAGDDLIYVSSGANLGLLDTYSAADGSLENLHDAVLHDDRFDPVTGDVFQAGGTLDFVSGDLNIDAGAGENTLSISDRHDPDADAAVTITDTSITGLAVGDITYGATTGSFSGQGTWAQSGDWGLFGVGISVYAGSGGNTIDITSVSDSAILNAPFSRTVTQVFAGGGSDTVNVAVTESDGRYLVVRGETGNDAIDASQSTVPVVLFGDAGGDTLTGGPTGDLLFGDSGRITFIRPTSAGAGLDVVLGAPADASDLAGLSFDEDSSTADLFVSVLGDSDNVDRIIAAGGNDVIVGGGNDGADINDPLDVEEIDAGEGDNTVLGDSGLIHLVNALLTEIRSFDAADGGRDDITAGSGFDVVIGGAGGDKLTAGEGSNIIVGDSGRAVLTANQLEFVESIEPAVGGSDTITTGTGSDYIIGGALGDTITTNDGLKVIVGDGGRVVLEGTDIVLVETVSPGVGGADTITTLGTTARNIAIGGALGDFITLSDGDNTVVGDDGRAVFQGGILTLVESIVTLDVNGNPELTGGVDIITGGDGSDNIIGGQAGDIIQAGDGRNIVMGDSGKFLYELNGDLSLAETDFSGDGGIDDIDSGSGNDVLLGGAAGDFLDAAGGDNVVLGDSGRITFLDGIVDDVASVDEGVGGVDDIDTSGTGRDVIVGGAAGDFINTGDGQKVVLGDSGSIDLVPIVDLNGEQDVVSIQTTAPGVGGVDHINTLGTTFRNIVIGGALGDFITVGDGDNTVVGDDGRAVFTAGILTLVESIVTLNNGIPVQTGGVDTITGGDGSDNIIGGQAGDIIQAGDGRNIVMGDSGKFVYEADGDLSLAETAHSADGGIDAIDSGSGNDVLLGGGSRGLPGCRGRRQRGAGRQRSDHIAGRDRGRCDEYRRGDSAGKTTSTQQARVAT